MSLTAWSYSRWSTYDKCPKQLEYKFIQKLPEPPSTALERGSAVHADVAAYILGDLPVNDPIPGWTYFEGLFRDLREMSPLVEQQWGFTKQWAPTGWFGADTWFRSVLDAALIYADGTADVIDFKTGKPSAGHAQQAELYAVSVVRRYPETQSVTVRFWYLDLEQRGKESVFRFSRDTVPALLKVWSTRAEKMLSDKNLPPRPGTHCQWCPFGKAKGGPCKYG
jgi:hypothetical protein